MSNFKATELGKLYTSSISTVLSDAWSLSFIENKKLKLVENKSN